jgi:Domain of unknown function (DUF4406)
MTGYPQLNFPAFDKEAERLRKTGASVCNPCDIFRTMGVNPDNPPVMDRDLIATCVVKSLSALASCDRIRFLEGWSQSSGARIEAMAARLLNILPEFCGNAVHEQVHIVLGENVP